LCGRFTLFADYEQILERFDVDVAFDGENYSFNFNGLLPNPLSPLLIMGAITD